MKKKHNVFISYRHDGGEFLASLLKAFLEQHGYSVFMDISSIGSGNLEQQLMSAIKESKNFIICLTKNSLDNCFGDKKCKDWIHKEVVQALKCQVNVIPLIHHFPFQYTKEIPSDMAELFNYSAIKWCHSHQEVCLSKIVKYLK